MIVQCLVHHGTSFNHVNWIFLAFQHSSSGYYTLNAVQRFWKTAHFKCARWDTGLLVIYMYKNIHMQRLAMQRPALCCCLSFVAEDDHEHDQSVGLPWCVQRWLMRPIRTRTLLICVSQDNVVVIPSLTWLRKGYFSTYNRYDSVFKFSSVSECSIANNNR